MLTSIKVNYHAAKLGITSVGLQGLRTAQDVTPEKLKYIQLSGEINLGGSADSQCPPLEQHVDFVRTSFSLQLYNTSPSE